MSKILSQIKDFWFKYELKMVLLVGFLLVSSLSFGAGVLWGQKWQQKPLIVEKQIDAARAGEMPNQGISEPSSSVSQASGNVLGAKPKAQNPAPATASCTYVGSKNSTKFYLATCSWAKQIKPENVVCFASPQEATAQGRTESKCN